MPYILVGDKDQCVCLQDCECACAGCKCRDRINREAVEGVREDLHSEPGPRDPRSPDEIAHSKELDRDVLAHDTPEYRADLERRIREARGELEQCCAVNDYAP